MHSGHRTGFVYFVQAPINGFIKIGHTAHHPDRRLESLRSGSPVPLVPLGVMPGSQKTESRLHIRFHHLRSHSEWFSPDPDLLAYIAKNCHPWPECDKTLKIPTEEEIRSRWESEVNYMLEWAEAILRIQNRGPISS